MKFDWDEKKNAANIQKHGFDFADGEELFDGQSAFLVVADEDDNYGEDRWRGIGVIQGRVVVAAFTDREPGIIRFISLRKANQQEQRAYEEAIKDELGPH